MPSTTMPRARLSTAMLRRGPAHQCSGEAQHINAQRAMHSDRGPAHNISSDAQHRMHSEPQHGEAGIAVHSTITTILESPPGGSTRRGSQPINTARPAQQCHIPGQRLFFRMLGQPAHRTARPPAQHCHIPSTGSATRSHTRAASP